MRARHNRTYQCQLWTKKYIVSGGEGRQNDQLYSHRTTLLKVSRQKEEVINFRRQSSLRSSFLNFELGLQLHWGSHVPKRSKHGWKQERRKGDSRGCGFFFNFEGGESRETFGRDETICEKLDVFQIGGRYSIRELGDDELGWKCNKVIFYFNAFYNNKYIHERQTVFDLSMQNTRSSDSLQNCLFESTHQFRKTWSTTNEGPNYQSQLYSQDHRSSGRLSWNHFKETTT